MAYRGYFYECKLCPKLIKGGMGIAAHCRGKEHRAKMAEKRKKDPEYRAHIPRI